MTDVKRPDDTYARALEEAMAEATAGEIDRFVADRTHPLPAEFRGGKIRFRMQFRGFDLELPVDCDLRWYLLEGGVDEEDAVEIVHVDFPRLSWRRGVLRGSRGVTYFPGLNLTDGLFGAPGATLCRARSAATT